MANRWVVDEEYPDGHLVPMTAEEEAQLERDQQAGVAFAAAQAVTAAAVEARISDLAKARLELAAGSIFSSFSTRERNVLDMLINREAP